MPAMTLPPVLCGVVRWTCIFLIVASFLTFFWATYNCVNLWWYDPNTPWSRLENPTWQLSYNALERRYKDVISSSQTIAPLEYGTTNVGTFGMCGGTLVAALATLVLRSLPRRPKYHKPATALERLGAACKAVLFYQLPPRRMWLWWCGGMHVLDLGIILALCALGAIWTEQLSIGYFRYIDAAIDYGTFEESYEGLSRHMARVEAVGNRTGWLALAGALVLFYPVPRNSFLQALFGVDFSFLIKYHRWFGHFTMLGTAVHGVIYYVAWGIEDRFAGQFRWWQIYAISNLAGNLSFIFGLILWATSLQIIRRNYFEFFYRFHIIGFIGFYFFGFVHFNGFWYYAAPGFMLYLLDLTFRLAQWMNVSVVTGSLVARDVLALQLSFHHTSKLKPNSFVFMSVPDASRSEWHPFTLSMVRNTNDPDRPNQATIFMRPYGKWVQSVVKRIASKGSALVKIDGPYGGSSAMIDRPCEIVVIFAGGIGVTPMLGLLMALREQKLQANGNGRGLLGPQKVIFIWAAHGSQMFELLDQDLLADARQEGSWLEVQLFDTSNGEGGIRNGHAGDAQGAGNGFPVAAGAKDAMLSLQEASNNPDGERTLPPGVVPALQRPELKLASPFFLKPTLLQEYGIGYPLWALTHILAFFGAYFGALMGRPYFVIKELVEPNGSPSWIWYMIQLISWVIGTMGLPALVIFPAFLWRRKRAQRAVANGALSSPSMLPGWQDPGTKSEAGLKQASTQSGRPDIRSVLKNVKADHPHAPEIHVCAAGPPSMVSDVKFHCTDLSSAIGRTQFIYEIDSFAL